MVSSFSYLCLKYCLFILCSFIVNNASGIRCYVCGNGEGELPCSDFEREEKFVKECDAEYKACRTARRRESENSFLSRACEKNKLQDCKIANDIEYCYCKSNLCNFYLSSNSDDIDVDNDDEDLVEGSGILKTTSDKNSFESEIFPVGETPATPAKTAESSGCVLHYSSKNRTVLLFVSTFLLLYINIK